MAFSPDGKTIVYSSPARGTRRSKSGILRSSRYKESPGNDPAVDKSGGEADTDGSTLSLKAGGTFYAPSHLSCVAVRWPKLVAGAWSGKLYHLEALEKRSAESTHAKDFNAYLCLVGMGCLYGVVFTVEGIVRR